MVTRATNCALEATDLRTERPIAPSKRLISESSDQLRRRSDQSLNQTTNPQNTMQKLMDNVEATSISLATSVEMLLQAQQSAMVASSASNSANP